jgi:phosphomannomutase
MDMMAYYGTSLNAIWQDLTDTYRPCFTDRANLDIPDDAKAAFIDSLVEDAADDGVFGGCSVAYAGGIPGTYAELRLRSPDGSTENYLQSRPSGTEPLVRVYYEATSKETLAALRQAIDWRTPGGAEAE